ncbi:hypothetical protein Tco_0674728 [Tanacetum coccineum]
MEDPDGTLASVAQCIEQLQQISLSAQDNEYNLKQLLELIDTRRNAFTAVGSHSQAVPVLVNPLEYVHFDSRVIDDVSFDGMSFKDFFSTIRRLVLVTPASMYYKVPSDPITALKLLKNDEDLGQFVKACYGNNLKIDLFTKHNGYDIMKMIHEDLHPKKPVGHVDSALDGETNVPLDDVAHVVEHSEHKNEGNVNIPRIATDDPWLNKLVGNGTFIGQTDNPNPNLPGAIGELVQGLTYSRAPFYVRVNMKNED